MPINQEVEKRQQTMKKILHNNQPQAEDELKDAGGYNATTDPINKFSEATGGHKQEGVTNKKQTERLWTEEVKIRRHDKQHFANTGN
jgi:hypothetical protein